MSEINPTTGELEIRIITWLGGRKHVADHVELARARDAAQQHSRDRDT